MCNWNWWVGKFVASYAMNGNSNNNAWNSTGERTKLQSMQMRNLNERAANKCANGEYRVVGVCVRVCVCVAELTCYC